MLSIFMLDKNTVIAVESWSREDQMSEEVDKSTGSTGNGHAGNGSRGSHPRKPGIRYGGRLANGGAEGTPVAFKVITREELPLRLTLTGRYGPLLAAAAELKPTTALQCGAGANQSRLNAIRKTLEEYIGRMPQLEGLKVSQDKKQLFVFRP